jgi:hypothetical protein
MVSSLPPYERDEKEKPVRSVTVDNKTYRIRSKTSKN